MVEVLDNLVSNEINKQQANKQNPFTAMFNGLSGIPGITSIKLAKMDEEGNIHSVSDANPSNLGDVIRSLTTLPGGKKLEDMNVDELNVELKKEIKKQDYEQAAKIRDLITEKKKSKE